MLLLERLSGWLAELCMTGSRLRPTSPACSRCCARDDRGRLRRRPHQRRVVPPGVFIVEQGEAADTLFLILSGVVEVAQDAADGSRTRPPPAGTRGVLRRARRGPARGPLGQRHRHRGRAPVSSSPGRPPASGRRERRHRAGRRSGRAPRERHRARPTTVIDVRAVVDRKVGWPLSPAPDAVPDRTGDVPHLAARG